MMKIVLFFGNGNGYEAPAYRQAGVSSMVRRLRQILKTKDLTE